MSRAERNDLKTEAAKQYSLGQRVGRGSAVGRRAVSGVRALALVVAVASLSALTAGCSSTERLGYTPVRMDPDQARTKARGVSSRLLAMTGVKGKVTEPGPGVSRCYEYGDDLFSTSHPWSVYGLTDDQVDTGMRNLRKALDENGWKITKDGKAPSENQDPEIYAENRNEQFTLHVTAYKDGGAQTMLHFKVVSACFRAESASALDGQY
ncbi:hypothetical protein [Streptomyces sp. SudanB25_2051]|uniref:hypothetical protein n=1 Tax=Streptomyces sp. SudanB25_2051 TaxID=3035275 RepID=UPI003F56B2C1